jgi:hypothetical protein
MPENRVVVELACHPNDEVQAARVVEVLSRTATGLAMDGVNCRIDLMPIEVITEEIEDNDTA